MRESTYRRFACQLLVATLLVFGGMSTSSGAIIGTQDMLASEERAANLAKVDAALSRSDVQQQLTAMGVDPVHASERAADLSDAELADFAGELDALPAGQGAGEVLIVLLIVFLVLELTGVTNIF